MISHRPLAIVTGGSRGIGRAIALQLAEKGCDLAVIARSDRSGLQETSEEITRRGAECIPVLTDIGIRGQAEEILQQVRDAGREPDILVNNAGISYIGLLQDTDWGTWQSMVSTNLTGCYAMCHAVLPSMIRRHSGRILNISSVWGICGASCETAYSATKGGINAFTRALAKELAPSGIPVNAIACGAIDTEMNRWLSEEERRDLEEEIPAGRMGTPEEAADLALHILTGTTYLTGQIIALDGGWI